MGKNARTFGQDLMRGEHVVGGGKVNKPPSAKSIHDGSIKGNGGLADQVGDAAKARARHKADAIPGGGGGPNSAHRKFSEKMAERQRKAAADITALKSGLVPGKVRAAPVGLTTGEVEMERAPASGTSIFDPVLCELAYRWFCPPGGLVLDPFAGGSVRGIVASKLGRAYLGVDLRLEQVAANEAQAAVICAGDPVGPKWIVGDSRSLAELTHGVACDFVFSCPPYADLEVYSEDPRDISTMEHPDFLEAYGAIVAAACAQLKPNRFACFVIGDARDKDGFYYDLPGATVAAFEAAGLRLYNQAILVTAAGSLPVRVRRQFEAARKLGNTHQYVKVFCKGDPRKATEAVGECESGDIESSPMPTGAPAPAPAGTPTQPAPGVPVPRPAAVAGSDPASKFGEIFGG